MRQIEQRFAEHAGPRSLELEKLVTQMDTQMTGQPVDAAAGLKELVQPALTLRPDQALKKRSQGSW